MDSVDCGGLSSFGWGLRTGASGGVCRAGAWADTSRASPSALGWVTVEFSGMTGLLAYQDSGTTDWVLGRMHHRPRRLRTMWRLGAILSNSCGRPQPRREVTA